MWTEWLWTWYDCWCQIGWVLVFLKMLISWDFQTQQFLEFTLNGVKNRKTTSEWQFGNRKCLVDETGQKRMAVLVKDDRKAMGTQINKLWWTKRHLKRPWRVFHQNIVESSIVLKTTSKNRNVRMEWAHGRLKTGKTLPALMILYFPLRQQMEGSKFGINGMNQWTQLGLC